MKKVFKRAIPFVLVVVMCLCMAAPAFAATTVQGEMSGFPSRSSGGTSDGYVGLIQRAMCAYSATTQDYIANSGGIDEGFGAGTYNAVVAFQRAVGLTQDGIVGSGTWSALANRLGFYRTTSTGYRQFSINGYVVTSISNVTSSGGYYYVSSSSQWYYYKYSARNNDYITYNSAFVAVP